MASGDLRAFVRANLPEPPARVLEVGAGDGRLGRALRAAGYDVLAIDPRSEQDDVRAIALADLDEPAGSFAAGVAIVSLHHVDPLEASCRRLAEVIGPGGTLVVDEFDIGRFDVTAAAWWLEQCRAFGEPQTHTAEELVEDHRSHLHPLERIIAALEPYFDLGPPVRGPWLHRWKLDESVRSVEEEAIARGTLGATGARLVCRRRD
jgi:2-polyprenyl-3-methyl-5-hydroxy-6-metoxy-1,4-benzoquinol methylase